MRSRRRRLETIFGTVWVERFIERRPRSLLRRHPLRRVKACAKKFGVTVTIVADFIHVLEYLWKAAYCFHSDGSQEAQDWVTERAWRLLEGASSHVAAGMRRSATKRGLSSKQRKAVDKCADYLLKRREFLRYDKYLSMAVGNRGEMAASRGIG